jgi:hypothetical protein
MRARDRLSITSLLGTLRHLLPHDFHASQQHLVAAYSVNQYIQHLDSLGVSFHVDIKIHIVLSESEAYLLYIVLATYAKIASVPHASASYLSELQITSITA